MLYLGVLMAGAIFVPLNTGYTASEIEYFKGDSEPALFVNDAPALIADSQAYAPLAQSVARSESDLASLIYTSGTTGRSKGAMLSHGNLSSNARAVCEAWGYSSDDVLLHALPIFHVHGLFIAMHCALLKGAPMLWLAKFDDADALAMLPRASVMMGVPTFYTRLLSNPAFTKQAAAHMRLFVSGSAPLLPSTFEEFEQRTGSASLSAMG